MIGPNTPQMSWQLCQWLAARGVPTSVLISMATLRLVNGIRADDGFFEEDPAGAGWPAFYEEAADDAVFWQPETDAVATWHGRAFALGEDNIVAAATYAFDNHLHVHTSVLDWLRDKGRGIVVIDWRLAFDRLRDAPRIAIAETLLPKYREAMKPNGMPELSVLVTDAVRRAA